MPTFISAFDVLDVSNQYDGLSKYETRQLTAIVIIYFDYIKQVLRYLFFHQDVQSLWKKLLKLIQLTEKASRVVSSFSMIGEIKCVGFWS